MDVGFTSTLEDVACDVPTTWTFTQVAGHANLADALGDGELCVDGNQYVYRLDGQTYPTCVLFENEGQPCVDDLVCTTGSGVAGFVGGQASFLSTAISGRNDHKHAECPTVQDTCTPIKTYWRNLFLGDGVPAEMIDNMCSEPEVGEFRYVQESGYQNMCVGFSTVAQTECPLNPAEDTYVCGGIDAGKQVFGWPGVISKMVKLAADAGDMKHPQCRY